MLIEETQLKDVLLLTPDTFRDHRGLYIETYNLEDYVQSGIPQLFVQDDVSVSYRNVLRGIHMDCKTWKLISCPVGTLWLAVVNLQPKSEQYMQWQGFALSGTNYRQVLVPPFHGNGHFVTSDVAVFQYKQTTYYERAAQLTIAYNDPALNIAWPIPEGVQPILSVRDKLGA